MDVVRVIKLTTGSTTLTVWVAETVAERWRGVRGLPDLRPGTGVLLSWKNTGWHALTMQGVAFPLDLIWLDEQLHVTSVARRVMPETSIIRGYGKAVLELAAGQAAASGLVAGVQLR